MAKRRNFSPDFKAKVALEALQGDPTIQEIAAKHNVNPNQVRAWKDQAIDGLQDVFSGAAGRSRPGQKAEAPRNVAISDLPYRTLIDSIPASVAYIDANRCYQFVNKTFEEWFGIAEDDVLGRHLKDILGEEFYDLISDKIDKAFDGKEITFEVARFLPQRGLIQGQFSYVPDRDANGDVHGYFSLLTDVSQSHLARERIRDFAESSSDWFWETDEEGRYTYFSGRDEEISGLPTEMKIGKTRAEIAQLFSDEPQTASPSSAMMEIETRVAAREPFTGCQFWLTGADGQKRFIAVSGKPFYDIAGNFAGYRGTGSDLTERKRAEDALIEFKHVYQQLVDMSHDAIFLQTSENGRIAFANQAARDLLRVEEDIDLVGLDLVDFLHPDYRADARSRNRAVLMGSHSRPITSGLLVRKDGTSVQVERRVTTCHHEGKPAFISNVRDISLKYEAQQKLKNSEARLSSILNIAPIAIIAISEDGVIELFNTGAEKIFGYEASEVIGHNINMLIPERLRKIHDSHIADFKSSGQSKQRMQLLNQIHALRRDGSEFPAEASVSREDLPSGTVMTVVLSDVTDRLQAEKKLHQALEDAEKATRTKSAFLANMSHEIRTPMNGVVGMVDVLTQMDMEPEQERMIQTIRNSSFALLGIIDDILDTSKIEAGELKLENVPVQLSSVIEAAVQTLIPSADDKKVRLSLFIDPALPDWIRSDAVRMRQVLINLLSNAIKFSSKKEEELWGSADISAQLTVEGELQFVVTDNGIGMTEEVQARLFKPFSQGEESTTRKFGGTCKGPDRCEIL